MQFFLAIVILLLIALWIYSFVQLMLLSEDDFPGRHDKILWVAAFLVLFIPAPVAFHLWKKAYLAMAEPESAKD